MINLPSILSETTWFYEDNKEELKHLLGVPYISYSTTNSWFTYQEDLIKQKFAGIKLPDGIYASLGNYVGEAIENGNFAKENPNGFAGQENIDLNRYRKPNAEYEKIVIIERDGYFIVGFIDIFYIDENGLANLEDNKTGGKAKEKDYESDDYIQTVLYGHYIENKLKLKPKIGVNFIRREGSHVNPPLTISKEQFYIPNVYSPERVEKALNKIDKAVVEISELYTTYLKFFAEKK